MSFVTGNLVVQFWTALDKRTSPLVPKSGLTFPPDVDIFLHKQVDGTMAVASETVAWAEIGVLGRYYLTFTPTTKGLFVMELQELHADTFKRYFRFPDIGVVAAGAVQMPSYANAFCAESDVERWAQLDFTSTSNPSDLEVTSFAEGRASEMIGMLAEKGVTLSPSTITVGSTEEDMARETNAIGAAADAIIAKFMQVEVQRTEKAAALLEEYDKRLQRLITFAVAKLRRSQIRTHITAGEVTLKTPVTVEEDGLDLGIKMKDEY